MVFDALRVGIQAGYDIEQLHVRLEEPTDTAALADAFQSAMRRHSALSSEFRWEQNGHPEQRVAVDVSMPVQLEDWSAFPAPEQHQRIREFLASDRRRGFDLRRAPLARLSLFRMGPAVTELVWTVHHLLVDATSIVLVLSEAFAAYERSETAPSKAPRVPRYRDYVEWAASIDRDKGRAFFRTLLAFAPAPPPLPFGRSKTSQSSATPDTVTLRVGARQLEALRATAARTEITVATYAQVAWAVVLSRYCGERDIVFGATRACRYSPSIRDMDEMVGLVANTLPMRARIRDECSAMELLRELRAQNLAIRPHEHLPLYEIEHRHGGPHTPLFETTLTYQKWELNRALRQKGGVGWERRRCALFEMPTPPLNVRICESDGLEVTLTFDTARLERTGVEGMGAALLFVLEQLSRDETCSVGEISILPPDCYQQVVFGWNQTAQPFAEDLLIHELFEGRVSSQPDAIALECSGRRMSYLELDEAANRVAHALQKCGVQPGQFVAICVGRGIDLVVSMLGVAKSGAAYVPLDPRYPTSRLRFVVEDAGAACVITERRYRSQFGLSPMLVIDDDWWKRQSPMRPFVRARSTDACYAIYTSGTTGDPNGVVMSHRAVMNTLEWVNRTFEVGSSDRALFVTSPCFDLSVFDVFGVLGAGATVVVATDDELVDFSRLARTLRDASITLWNSTPATLGALIAADVTTTSSGVLRLVLLSGDWIPVSLPDVIRERFPRAQVISLGGATEAAIWSNWYPIECVDPSWPSIPYGVPIQNCRYHILDSNMRPVPVGVAGDLYIGGVCLAEGYLNRAELTKERFLPDPFGAQSGQRLYRTGDRALYLEDGQIRLLGRSDSQVKIRGLRVELGEVEAVLRRVPGVKDGIVVASLDGSGERSLGAYVVRENGQEVDSCSVREHLGRKLPPYAVPAQITFIDSVPLTHNGKVDRKALPVQIEQLGSAARVAPRNAMEREMAILWEAILKKSPIGVTDDFFALGGHSLLAVALVARIKSQWGWELSLAQFLEKPTIEGVLLARNSQLSKDCAELFLAFNTRGKNVPLVLLPGVYGSPFTFRELPMRLGPEQPVYLGRAFGPNGTVRSFVASIERMAEAYLNELTALCDVRRIVVGGYSFGILLAFEMACLAERRGIDVPLMISLDGLAPGYPRFLPIKQRLLAHWRELTRGEERRRYVADRLHNVRRRLFRVLGREYELTPKVQTASPEMKQVFKRVYEANIQASRSYRPGFTHSADMLLFRAERPERWIGREPLDGTHGWGTFVRGAIDVVTLPGDHDSILEQPNDRMIVEKIVERLSGLRDEQRSSGVISGDGGSVVPFEIVAK